MVQEQRPSADPIIPWPSPSDVSMFHNINQNSVSFLRAAGIQPCSKQYKVLTTTVRALHRQYLHPYKYVEEQSPSSVDRLIAKAKISLPWLAKYQDGWPARIYLKRYVDGRRPHLQISRHDRLKKLKENKLQVSHDVVSSSLLCQCPQLPSDPSDMPGFGDSNPIVREFLSSLTPSLDHHLDTFVELGVKDQKSLEAFLSWPHVTRVQFLNEGHEKLQLTSLERQGLLLGCDLLIQRALRLGKSLVGIVEPASFRPSMM